MDQRDDPLSRLPWDKYSTETT
uniref:Uncharacterized protein n=1 Tax=Arundo donax TaxID=35708 RepID=A0A0A9HHV7_ARUDO